MAKSKKRSSKFSKKLGAGLKKTGYLMEMPFDYDKQKFITKKTKKK